MPSLISHPNKPIPLMSRLMGWAVSTKRLALALDKLVNNLQIKPFKTMTNTRAIAITFLVRTISVPKISSETLVLM